MDRTELDGAYRKGFREGYEKAAGVALREGAVKGLDEAAAQLLAFCRAPLGEDPIEVARQSGVQRGHFLGTLAKRGLLPRDRAKQLGWSEPLVVSAQIKFLREAFRRDGAEGETAHAVCDALEEAQAEIARLKGEGPGYGRAEEDIAAWLLTQTPVPVCQGLAERVLGGEHRGRAKDRKGRWEIPVTLTNLEELTCAQAASALASLGMQLAVTDDGRPVAVREGVVLPSQLEATCDLLRMSRFFTKVGTPVFVKELAGPSGGD